MEAVVLAGGFGTRLRGLVSDVPKPMAPIGDTPFLALLLERLAQRGFGRVVLSAGYLAPQITSYFGDGYAGMQLSYHIEAEPLGTGGALKAAFGQLEADHAFVFNGDTFLDLEVKAAEAHYHRDGRPVIVVRQVPSTERYGRVEIDGSRVVSLVPSNSPTPGFINAGCYVLPRDVFGSVTLGPVFSMEQDFLPEAIRRGSYSAFVTEGYFIDIGVPEDYRRAVRELPAIVARA